MSWDLFSQLFGQEATRYKTHFLSPQRVDVEVSAEPIHEGKAYCRLWLVEMHLARDTEWGTTRYPVVYSAIRFTHGGEKIIVPYLAGPDMLQEIAGRNLNQIISRDHALTPLFPFNSGLVELQAGLLSMVADNRIKGFINSIERFAKLLPVPELSAVVKIANPLVDGIQDLLRVSERRLELGYQQTFVGAEGKGHNLLKPGYFVVILAGDRTIDEDALCVVNGGLYFGAKGKAKEFLTEGSYHQPLDDYSYMLFRLETRRDQDWESLTYIKDLVHKAYRAIAENNYKEVKTKILPAIKIAIFESPDLTKDSKKEMVGKIEDVLKQAGLQATGPSKPLSLYAIMQRDLPPFTHEKEAELAELEALFHKE